MSWDTVSPGYRPLSWGYPGILRMPPVSHDANLRFQMWCKFPELKRRWSGRQFLHETTLCIKRGQMERDLLLCMKRRPRAP